MKTEPGNVKNMPFTISSAFEKPINTKRTAQTNVCWDFQLSSLGLARNSRRDVGVLPVSRRLPLGLPQLSSLGPARNSRRDVGFVLVSHSSRSFDRHDHDLIRRPDSSPQLDSFPRPIRHLSLVHLLHWIHLHADSFHEEKLIYSLELLCLNHTAHNTFALI